MKQHPIAILLVFRNQPEEAERLLSQIYTRLEPHYQLYIVDDSSDDNTPQVIESVIAHYGHDDTFFFENPTELGRRRSIKELMQIIEPPIIWIPEDIDAEFQDLMTLTSMVRQEESGEQRAGSGEREWEEVHECREARSLLTDIENVVSETGSGRKMYLSPQ